MGVFHDPALINSNNNEAIIMIIKIITKVIMKIIIIQPTFKTNFYV